MTNMDTQSALEQLGLTATEASVYHALLAHGPTSIRALAVTTSINRGTVYDTLKHLAGTGLVAHVRKGERNKYRAESPQVLRGLLDDRRRSLQQAEAIAKDLIPSLLAVGDRLGDEPRVRFYEDDDGIVLILRDVVKTAATLHPRIYYAYSSRALRKYLYRRFPTFTRRRIHEDIFVKVIAAGAGGEPDANSERRWIAEPQAATLSSYILIYGPKVALISVAADDTPYGVVIEEPGVAAMQKLLFDTLWSHLEA